MSTKSLELVVHSMDNCNCHGKVSSDERGASTDLFRRRYGDLDNNIKWKADKEKVDNDVPSRTKPETEG